MYRPLFIKIYAYIIVTFFIVSQRCNKCDFVKSCGSLSDCSTWGLVEQYLVKQNQEKYIVVHCMVFIKKHFVITCTLHVSTGIIHYYDQITGFEKSPVWLSGMSKFCSPPRDYG